MIGDNSRIEQLCLLTNGRYYTIHELEGVAKLINQIASYHLSKLHHENGLELYKREEYSYCWLSNEKVAKIAFANQ